MQPIQMESHPNQQIFSEAFFAFLESTKKFEYFERKDEPQRLFISEIIDRKKLS